MLRDRPLVVDEREAVVRAGEPHAVGLVVGQAEPGGWIDAIVSRFVDVVMTFSLLLFLLMLATTTTPHLDHVTFGAS